METLDTLLGQFTLARYPERPDDPLRAWDAADEYLLGYLAADEGFHHDTSLLILNDTFGALATTLASHRPVVVSDSIIAHLATAENLRHNQLSPDAVTLLTSLDTPSRQPDWVVIKIPKTLALLEDQLHRIRPLLSSQTRVVAAGMVKGIHTSTLKLFERLIGPTRTSLAQKKARLIFASLAPSLRPGQSPYPSAYRLEGSDHTITNHANLFSRQSLDIGTRLLLAHLPSDSRYRRIVDLGCGNGVLGLIAAERNPEAELTFIDESFMAVASAEDNFRSAFGTERAARFIAADCLDGEGDESAELILNNPPFHQQNAVGDFIARQMFSGARRVLKRGGELWVIGNRHLAYHTKLKRLFGNCTTEASNRKFVVLRAVKR